MASAQDQTRARFLCPNCEQRMPDTSTTYDEVLMSDTVSRSFGRGMHRISSRSLSIHGRVWLCGQCSRSYLRMVALRERGHRLLRWGAIGLAGGVLLLALLYAAFEGEDVALTLISLPALIGAVVVLLGTGMIVFARLRRRSAARFLHNPHLAHMAAPPERLTPGISTSSLTAPVERLTAEDRRRARRNERLRALAIAGGSIALIAILVTVLSLGIQRQRALTQGYSVDLTTTQGGWSNGSNDCAFKADGYHLAPQDPGKGITCFAPAGDFSNFDVQTTARLVSGPTSTDYGVDFRLGDDLTVGDGYVFEMTDDGSAWLALIQNGSVSPISSIWQLPASVSRNLNAAHMLMVEARGSTLTCFVDGAEAGSYSDGRFTAGRLGLYVGQSGSDVVFTAFSVTPE